MYIVVPLSQAEHFDCWMRMFEEEVERYFIECWQWHSNRAFPQVSHDSTHIRADVGERLG